MDRTLIIDEATTTSSLSIPVGFRSPDPSVWAQTLYIGTRMGAMIPHSLSAAREKQEKGPWFSSHATETGRWPKQKWKETVQQSLDEKNILRHPFLRAFARRKGFRAE